MISTYSFLLKLVFLSFLFSNLGSNLVASRPVDVEYRRQLQVNNDQIQDGGGASLVSAALGPSFPLLTTTNTTARATQQDSQSDSSTPTLDDDSSNSSDIDSDSSSSISSDSPIDDSEDSLSNSHSNDTTHHSHSHGHRVSIDPTTGFPPSPKGATLVQYQPCKEINATVPMFVNDAWAGNSTSKATRAFIITHGAGRDFNNAFHDISDLVDEQGVLIAPAFYIKDDSQERFKPNWYQEGKNLAWENDHEAESGSNVLSPETSASCSTFSVYDSLVSTLSDRDKYPQLSEIVFAGHSNGAGQTIRYSVVADPPPRGIKLKFAVANTPSFPYFTSDRPLSYDLKSNLESEYTSWPYGIQEELSPYVKNKIGDMNGSELFSKWASVDVRTLVGDRDTFAKYPFGDISPGACIQGPSRRDRNYAFWAYRVLLAGVREDVSDYYGYRSLSTLNGGVKSLNVKDFKSQHCNVQDVGHEARKMWHSKCGRSALLESKMSGGVGPRQPGPLAKCTHRLSSDL